MYNKNISKFTEYKKILVWIFIFSFAGLLFAGYLSGVKFFTETCVFNESCPYFLGYPACYFGLVMYLALSVVSYLLVFGRLSLGRGLKLVTGISFIGILFAGYFTLLELPLLFSEGLGAYFFGLPTCALGLIFYVCIFILSLTSRPSPDQELSVW